MVVCAASRVRTRSRGYVNAHAIMPALPPAKRRRETSHPKPTPPRGWFSSFSESVVVVVSAPRPASVPRRFDSSPCFAPFAVFTNAPSPSSQSMMFSYA